MGFILLLDKQKVMLFCLFQIINLNLNKRLKVDTTELHFKKGEEISLEMCHCVTLAALISFSFFCPVTIVLYHKP